MLNSLLNVSMWATSRCSSSQDPLLVTGVSDADVALLAQGLHRPERPLVWVEVRPQDAGDPIALGDRLAEGVRRGLGVDLIHSNVPWAYGLEALRGCADRLGPWVIVLCGAERAPDLARGLLTLHDGSTLALLYTRRDLGAEVLFRSVRVLGEHDLRVQADELLTLQTAAVCPPEVMADAHARSGGSMAALLQALHDALGVPGPPVSLPGRDVLPGSHLHAQALLEHLLSKDRWIEALEVAAGAVPWEVARVAVVAGHLYHERGLHRRLFELLDGVAATSGDEHVLRWWYSSACRTGQTARVRPTVEAFLHLHEAPELRALHATTALRSEARRAALQRAVHARATPLTLYLWGMTLAEHTPHDAVPVLVQAVNQAEQGSWPYEVVRNAGALAATLSQIGEFEQAVFWSEFALRHAEQHGVRDGQRRLCVLNEWAYASLLTRQAEHVLPALLSEQALLPHSLPTFAASFESTIADGLVCQGDAVGALRRYEAAGAALPRQHAGWRAVQAVRCLTELGEVGLARQQAQRALALTQHEEATFHRWSELAYGMALAFATPEEAVEPLRRAMDAFRSPLRLDAHVRAATHLALALLRLSRFQEAREALRDVRGVLSGLSEGGRRLLGGCPEVFAPVWALLSEAPSTPTLTLNLLGPPEVRLGDVPLALPPRALEMLALLALHPEGLSGEQFAQALYGDQPVAKSSLKPALSRLRDVVPLRSHPYRLAVPCKADFLDVVDALRAGDVGRAVEGYRGPLLPRSEAPDLVECREMLEEGLRQAALHTAHGEVRLTVAERLKDDLELWEAALKVLAPEHPRHAYCQLQTRRVRAAYGYS